MKLLTTYLKLEKELNMEYMLKEQIYITYYAELSDFKNDMFFLDNDELKSFLDDSNLDQSKLIKSFIMLYDKKSDLYVVWTEADSLNTILEYFSNKQEFKVFIT